MNAKRLTSIIIICAVIVATGYLLAHSGNNNTGSNTQGGDTAALTSALSACNAYPNNSTQHMTETSRETIYLPKNLYPNQGGLLSFNTATGTATAGWISNAGPVGNSYGATANCWAYYYEFDGTGQVDLTATSSVADVPDYVVHFTVGPVMGDQMITYTNNTYGFTFTLPASWRGYTIVNKEWQGYAVTGPQGQSTVASGPEILIRNPKWTEADPYQDIPIMVFTTTQWQKLQNEDFTVSAAPIPPSELDHNAKYVFALPPRYNYAFPAGYQEVDQIMQTHPLHAF